MREGATATRSICAWPAGQTKPFYRSDATYFERLHWEAAVDISPEELAKRAGNRFRRPSSSPA